MGFRICISAKRQMPNNCEGFVVMDTHHHALKTPNAKCQISVKALLLYYIRVIILYIFLSIYFYPY